MSTNMAFILGYTGATGKALVKELITDDYFTKIVLVGRRKCDMPEGADDRFVQEIVDYDKIGEYSHVFKDCTVGYCCLGCSDFGASKETFNLIDRDYVINTATVAKEAGCQHFHLLTSVNSNKDSWKHYRKVKGEAEHGVRQLEFNKLTIYRPGFILTTQRQGFRYALEGVIKCLSYPCLHGCCKKTTAIKVEGIAKAMVYKTKNPASEEIDILENIDIYQLSN